VPDREGVSVGLGVCVCDAVPVWVAVPLPEGDCVRVGLCERLTVYSCEDVAEPVSVCDIDLLCVCEAVIVLRGRARSRRAARLETASARAIP